eukprot:CAMPEP_0194402644 /NCGR_PEP_ID=MMETSP0176-20130528/1310_1 /TAXON_ID=216777 /ORGANISM="Proboscia alata, Strain PI-D3" /LENGTH=406 /DNA_ID=CAMNT_0039200075 /DNA_START=86 /DNA_END=1307 /DNA_ORIENTATION=+
MTSTQNDASTSLNVEEQIDHLWKDAVDQITKIDPSRENWKAQNLPLARIKKIMKSEEGIYQFENMQSDDPTQSSNNSGGTPAHRFMIAGEAPVLLGKACELMIREVTKRAWSHTEKNRRRTLQRQDVHAAVAESDVYDFLIDIVPRVSLSQPSSGIGVAQGIPSHDQLNQSSAFPSVNMGGIASTPSNNPVSMNNTGTAANPEAAMQQYQQMQEQMNTMNTAAAFAQNNFVAPIVGQYQPQFFMYNPTQPQFLGAPMPNLNVTAPQQQAQQHVQQHVQQQHAQQQVQQQVQHQAQQQANNKYSSKFNNKANSRTINKFSSNNKLSSNKFSSNNKFSSINKLSSTNKRNKMFSSTNKRNKMFSNNTPSSNRHSKVSSNNIPINHNSIEIMLNSIEIMLPSFAIYICT